MPRRPSTRRTARGAARLLAIATVASTTTTAASATADDAPIELLSFNIRYDNPRDGEHRWANRRELVLETIRDRSPDFVGLQEALPHQRAWLDGELAGGEPAWASLGRARERSMTSGEANPLLHRVDRWERLDGGTFWLSETPERIGSRSWGAACPRIATWGIYRRWSDDGEPDAAALPVLVVNTHFDHVSAEARRRGAESIVEFIERRRDAMPGMPTIVMGDLNAGPDSPAVATLLDAGLVDTHRVVAGTEEIGTFHGFRGDRATEGRPRIDFILADERFEVLEAGIEPSERGGRLVSDHRPVRARLRSTPSDPEAASAVPDAPGPRSTPEDSPTGP